MAEEKPPAKKVVKRVVKKAAPSSDAATRPSPTIRYGRPVKTDQAPSDTAQPARTATTKAPKAKASSPKPREATTDTIVREEPVPDPLDTVTIDPVEESEQAPTESGPGTGDRLRESLGSLWHATRDRLADGRDLLADRFDDARDAVSTRVDGARSTRLPTIDPLPASWLTGLLVGAVAVLLGRGALELFSLLRGVASGGGTWGTLTFVVVGFIAFAVGERLLAGLKVELPRLTSGIGVLLTVLVMLVFFIETADSWMAVFIVPASGAVCYSVAHWLMTVSADESETPAA